MECRVEYDYQAQEPDELTLKKGDIIKDVVTKMDGWWEGTLGGKRGMFPDNFVKVTKHAPVVGENSFPKTNAGPAGDETTSAVNFRKNSAGNTRRLKALFSYSPEQDDELSLAVGDVVEFIAEVEEGWWKRQLKGRVGIFPSNFVSDLSDSEGKTQDSPLKSSQQVEARSEQVKQETVKKDSPDVIPKAQMVEEPAPRLPPKPVRESARCFYSYTAQNEDELSLKEGDIVYIISKECEDDGWWKGELRGKTGLFPDNFVKIITPNEPVPPTGPFTKITAQERSIDDLKKEPVAVAVPDGNVQTKSEFSSVKGETHSFNFGKKAPAVPPQKVSTPTSPSSPFGDFIPKVGKSLLRSNSERVEEKESISETNEFNSVERGAPLHHPTANRAKPPAKRRPPSSPNTRDSDPSVLNGTDHHSSSESFLDSSIPSSMNHGAIQNNVESPTSGESPNSKDNRESVGSLIKPKIAGVGNPAPWITELKLKQDKKQTPTTQNISPIPPKEPAETGSPTHSGLKAPPLPAKPVLPNPSSFEKEKPPPPVSHSPTLQTSHSTNGTSSNPNYVNNKITTNMASKFGGQKKVINQTSTTNDGMSTDTTTEYVSYEEYNALKEKVGTLEAELDLVKKQLKIILERNISKGHIV